MAWALHSIDALASAPAELHPVCRTAPAPSWVSVRPITPQGAPPVVRGALGAWTGSELLLWAGDRPKDSAPSGQQPWRGWGFAYSPEKDRWRPLPGKGAPGPRQGASLVWTGTHAILWGGREQRTRALVRTGFLYDPVKGTARPLSTRGAPSPREDHIALWDGTRMLVFGGSADSGPACDAFSYDPRTDTWKPLAPPPARMCQIQPRKGSGVWTGSRAVLLVAGYEGNAVLVYEPAANRWSEVTGGRYPQQLIDTEGVLAPDGSVYVVGSHDVEGGANGFVYRLDPQAARFSVLAPSNGLGAVAVLGDMLVQLEDGGQTVIDLVSGGCARFIEHSQLPSDVGATSARTAKAWVIWGGGSRFPEPASFGPPNPSPPAASGGGWVFSLEAPPRLSPPPPPGTSAGGSARTPSVIGGVVRTTMQHCGGVPQPGPSFFRGSVGDGFQVIARRGDTNTDAPVVAEAVTDRYGQFELDLPPGTYCVLEGAKRASVGQAASGQRAECLKEWYRACDSVVTVTQGMKQPVDASFNVVQECFGRCYEGSLPP